MKRLSVPAFFAVIAIAASAEAAPKVTNLDRIPHVVAYDSAGSVTRKSINPDESVYFFGQPEGLMSLVTPSQSKKPGRSGAVHADGILSGILGAERTQDIPVNRDDTLVIWPGGRLMIQSRHGYRDAFN